MFVLMEKKPNRHFFSEYRPEYLLLCVGKIIEATDKSPLVYAIAFGTPPTAEAIARGTLPYE